LVVVGVGKKKREAGPTHALAVFLRLLVCVRGCVLVVCAAGAKKKRRRTAVFADKKKSTKKRKSKMYVSNRWMLIFVAAGAASV
jgi:hypothetical protein